MGEAGHKPLFDLDYALEKGDLSKAWYAATEAGVIHLDQFLRITLLLAEEDSPRFEAAARKFLVRFLREVKPPIETTRTVVDALWMAGDTEAFAPERGSARRGMVDLARQLRERRER